MGFRSILQFGTLFALTILKLIFFAEAFEMEVKDINNKTALAMLARNSAAAIGGGMIGDAFFQLVGNSDAGTGFFQRCKICGQRRCQAGKCRKPEESAKKTL